MKTKSVVDTIFKKRRATLIFTAGVAVLAVASLGVSTFAWFQANADVEITAEGDEAEITVSAPTGAVFYYFTGNGTPGTDYTGYSPADSAIGTAPRTISHDMETPVTPNNVGFAQSEGKTYYFQEITGEGTYTAANCFNFSKIRPGCYYSFCVAYASSSCGLALTLSNNRTGDNTTPKRKIGTSGSPGAAYNASLGLALNGYVSAASTTASAATYIKSAFDDGAVKASSHDKIAYPSSNMADNTVFTFANNINTTTNQYIYFTIYMGFNNKGDALLYNSKSGTGSSEIIYYTRDNTSGDYSAVDGLTMTLNKVEVTTA